MTEQITREGLELLRREDIRRAVEENIERDPVAVALDRHVPSAAEVAGQVKRLQRARKKLPSFYAARCIMPPLAYEQSSGEMCALRKEMEGREALDLTCGLGVDAWALAGRFGHVVTVERDEVLAEVARENFRRLGIGNIEVVCDSAEHYLRTCGRRFDWCFADPDRRGADGRKRVLAEDCSPDMTALLPVVLGGVAPKSCIKLSPMFDVDEAFRVFGGFGRCSVEVVSSGDECKEVLVYIDADREPSLRAVAVGKGEFGVDAAALEGGVGDVERACFDPDRWRWLIVPDVALQKSRLVRRYFGGSAFVAGENGFAFMSERPGEGLLGRAFEIESIARYDARSLRRELKGRRAEIMLRDTRLAAARILRDTGMREGGEVRMAVTDIGGEIWAIRLK